MTIIVEQEGDYMVTREDGVIISQELNRPPPPVAPIDTSKLMDHGPFFDRFGAAMMPVLLSTHPDVIAIRANLMSRKWVDLRLPQVAQSLAVVGAIVPQLTPELQNTILTTPVTIPDQYALLKVYFS